MRSYTFFLFVILSVTACSKDEETETTMNCSKGSETFTTDTGTKLDLDTQDWYLEKNEIGGGSIHLRISGSIIGDSATIRTYGDGVIYDSEIEIDNGNEFNKDVSISFTATTLPEGDIMSNTVIFVYNLADTLKADLESCVLRY